MAHVLIRRNLARSSEEHMARYPQDEGPQEHLRNALMVLQTFPYAGSETEIEDQLDAVSTVIARIKVALGQISAKNPPRRRRRELSVPERHQLKIARQTMRMPEAMVGVMGGPTKAEAVQIIRRLRGKTRNPAGQLWYPGGVGLARDPQHNYMAIPIETTVGWDVVTLRSMFPEGFDPFKLAVFEARLGYEFSGQKGYRLFKLKSGGKWTKPMPLRTKMTAGEFEKTAGFLPNERSRSE